MCASELEEDVGPLDAGRDLPEELARASPPPAPVPGEAMEAARSEADADAARPGSSGVSSAASSQSSAAAAVAPARCRLLGGGVELGCGDGVRALGRERHVACPFLDDR